MMISDADFDELFFDDIDLKPAKNDVSSAAYALRKDEAVQPRHDPLQDAATLAMMSPFGAAVAMMSVFGAPPRS